MDYALSDATNAIARVLRALDQVDNIATHPTAGRIVLSFFGNVPVKLAISVGDDAGPMEVEVSAVRGFNSENGIASCNSEPESAEAIAVYIRNPLAFHVQDFRCHGTEWHGESPVTVQMRQAFAYADLLAAHLGCAVASQLERPAAKGTPESVSRADEVEAACCIWEHALERQGEGGDMAAAFSLHGANEMRQFAMTLAIPCHLAWSALHEAGQYDEPFDWEFVPAWCAANVDWMRMEIKPAVKGA